jgi:hypothetical protein
MDHGVTTEYFVSQDFMENISISYMVKYIIYCVKQSVKMKELRI